MSSFCGGGVAPYISERRRLVEPRLDARHAHGLEQADGADAGGVGGVLGLVERHPHVRLRGEVVDLVGVDLGEQRDQAGAVAEVAVVQEELRARVVRVDVEVVDPRGVEGRGAADQPVHLVALRQQQLGEVGAVLAGDAGDECALGQGLLRSCGARWIQRDVDAVCDAIVGGDEPRQHFGESVDRGLFIEHGLSVQAAVRAEMLGTGRGRPRARSRRRAALRGRRRARRPRHPRRGFLRR